MLPPGLRLCGFRVPDGVRPTEQRNRDEHQRRKQTVDSMNRFAQDMGLLSKPVHYRQVVWT